MNLNFNWELIWVRVVSIGYKLLAGLITAVIAAVFAFLSDGAREIITSNLGTGVVGMLVLSALDESVKHLRNLSVLKKWQTELGGSSLLKPTLI